MRMDFGCLITRPSMFLEPPRNKVKKIAPQSSLHLREGYADAFVIDDVLAKVPGNESMSFQLHSIV